MQNYSYSVFSLLALVLHLIVNFQALSGRGGAAAYYKGYRGFLWGVLVYYVSDALWGILAGLRWTRLLYVDTIFFFLSLVVFVLMLSRFVIIYLKMPRWVARVFKGFGCALLATNIVLLALNYFNNCFFYFDENGKYCLGDMRDLAIIFLISMNLLVALAVLAKALLSKDDMRRRSMTVFLSCMTIAVSIVLQVVWPLTPFTSLGCLVGISFFQVYVVQEETARRHMADLKRALARANAAERSRSMFFSIVSHDIRTPLNAILGYSELLQHGVMRKTERDEAIASIRSSGNTLLQLVNDVLDLAKMDSGKMTLLPEPVRLDRLTNDVLVSFQMDAAGKGVALVNDTLSVPTVLLDSHRFRQILFNLIGNALKFTNRGSVTVSASYTGTTLELSVADTGCGIPPDMLSRIMDPFVQVQDTSHAADRSGGTGLGLSICRSLVALMGGKLSVESELGKGAKFTVRIPDIKTSSAAVAATEAKRTLVPEDLPKRVLVVDDSPVNRAVLTALLKKVGVSGISHACDGAEALSELDRALNENQPYDMVFSDFWMPNMNGMELIAKLRADSRFASLAVFALTADTEYSRDERARLFNGVLLKPLTCAKLVDTLSLSLRAVNSPCVTLRPEMA